MTEKPPITQALLRQLIRFDGTDYFWLTRARSLFSRDQDCRVWNKRFAGKKTLNYIDAYGYARVNIFGNMQRGHRIIWLFHYGEWPNDHIDHINGVRSDNRLVNLRVVTPAGNNKNMRLSKANTSGVMGVRKIHNGRWLARIKVEKRTVHLGYHSSMEDALSARRDAERKYGYHENHGSVK